MGARKNGGARETHKGRGSSLPPHVSPLRMFPSCTAFFLTYYFQAPAKQARIHCVRIKLYSWFSQSEMDVTFCINAELIPWFCDRCKHCSMTLNMLQLSHWKERQKWSQNNISNTTDHACHKRWVFVLKLRVAYLSIAQVRESKKVNEVSDLYSLPSRHLKVFLMGARKNRGCKGDTQGQRELPHSLHVSIAHVSIMHPVLPHILFPSAC